MTLTRIHFPKLQRPQKKSNSTNHAFPTSLLEVPYQRHHKSKLIHIDLGKGFHDQTAGRYTLGSTNIAMENGPEMKMYLRLNIVIFHCHVSLLGGH